VSVLVVVQARTGSSRFPGKVLAEVAGQTMLGFMLDRITSLADDPDTEVVVATSESDADDEVARIATSKGLAAVRGSEQDVLSRFQQALDEHPAEVVVRLTADCPLTDPAVIRAALDLHRATGADYTSNTLARTFPDGLDVEVMTSAALRWAGDHTAPTGEREHVTPPLYRHPRRFQIAQLVDDAQAGDERWTVDRPDDLGIIRTAVSVAQHPVTSSWTDLLDQLGRRTTDLHVAARPIPAEAHRPGQPYHRRWEVEDASGPAGHALVVVDDGGVSTLQIDGPRADIVDVAVRDRLQADLQVTKLTMGTGGTT
jgi:spore coat polysaccharide biosynthesis protein SpsF